MKVPIEFPSEEEVILEDVARFRALTPERQFRSLRGLFNSGVRMMRLSPRRQALIDYTREQEELAKLAFLGLVERHGPRG